MIKLKDNQIEPVRSNSDIMKLLKLTAFYIVLCLGLFVSVSASPPWKLPFVSRKFNINDFIADTLTITLPIDTLNIDGTTRLKVVDSRPTPGPLIGIQNTKKWKYIPVDQYLVLKKDLAQTLTDYSRREPTAVNGTLYVKNLVHWWDGSPFLNKGRKLNAYTLLADSNGQVMGDWLWEFTLKPAKKQSDSSVIAGLMDRWLIEQAEAVQQPNFQRSIYPYLYRRQLMGWTDFILLQDGYIVNAHLTLDFPADRQKSWIRGSPGIFYRRGHHHQSIAVGGQDQQWYSRLSDNFVRRLNVAFRDGVNNFDSDKYPHMDYWNLMLVNLSANAAFEYRPVYLKGLFAGVGLHASINILPDVIDRVEPGLLLTGGFILP